MGFKVMSVDEDTITVWDGITKDPKRGHPAGTLTLFIGAHHTFRKDDEVTIIVSKVYEEEAEVASDKSITKSKCAIHHAYHILGPNCVPDTINQEIDVKEVESRNGQSSIRKDG